MEFTCTLPTFNVISFYYQFSCNRTVPVYDLVKYVSRAGHVDVGRLRSVVEEHMFQSFILGS
jgi:hypothetical protein